MQLSLQAVLLNVSNLTRSIEFYRDVFEFRLTSRDEGVAALMIDETNRRQVLILRELGPHPALHAGRGSIGPRLLALEAGSLDELDAIEHRLTERKAFIGRRRTEDWTAIVGADPDRIEISVSSSLSGGPIQTEHWDHVDQMVYEVGE